MSTATFFSENRLQIVAWSALQKSNDKLSLWCGQSSLHGNPIFGENLLVSTLA